MHSVVKGKMIGLVNTAEEVRRKLFAQVTNILLLISRISVME